MGYDIEIMDREEDSPVLSVRTRTSVQNLPEELGKGYQAIAQYASVRSIVLDGPAFAAYYNMDMEDLDVELGFQVQHIAQGHGHIEAGVIPAGRYVTCKHVGSYSQLTSVYSAMNAWVDGAGVKVDNIAYEFYYNSPTEVPENQLVTRVMFRIKE